MNTTNSAYSAPIPSQSSKPRRHRSAEERAKWVGLYERSGETLKSFCLENGLALSTLMLWRRQVRGPLARRRTRGELIEVPLPQRIAPVALSARAEESPAVAIHIPNGMRVDVVANADVRWIAKLLSAVCRAQDAG